MKNSTQRRSGWINATNKATNLNYKESKMNISRRLTQVLFAPMFLALLIGCSGSSDSGTETTTTTTTTAVDITGSWTGTWTSSKALADGQKPKGKIEGTYTQTGKEVSGTTNLYSVGGCFVMGTGLSAYAKMRTSGTVQDKMIGGAVTSTISTATDKVFYSLEVVSATQMKGSYTISSSTKQKANCENGGGTFILNKK